MQDDLIDMAMWMTSALNLMFDISKHRTMTLLRVNNPPVLTCSINGQKPPNGGTIQYTVEGICITFDQRLNFPSDVEWTACKAFELLGFFKSAAVCARN